MKRAAVSSIALILAACTTRTVTTSGGDIELARGPGLAVENRLATPVTVAVRASGRVVALETLRAGDRRFIAVREAGSASRYDLSATTADSARTFQRPGVRLDTTFTWSIP